MTRPRTTRTRVAPLALLLALAGCGSEQGAGTRAETLYPVKGQVLLASGKPLTGGTVVFLPTSGQDSSPRGEVDSGGNFTLKSRAGDGAPAGDYKVRIEPSAAQLSKKGTVDPKALPFPARYTDEDGDTGLTATVKAEPTTLPPFKLTNEQSSRGNARGRD